MDPDNTSKLVCKALNVADVRTVRMHDFCHSCVSVLLGLGVPPRTTMEIDGTPNLEMTMNVYADVSLMDKRPAIDKTQGPLREDSRSG